MHAASGLLSWTMELLSFATRQFALTTMVSVRFINSHFVQFFLASERGVLTARYYDTTALLLLFVLHHFVHILALSLKSGK